MFDLLSPPRLLAVTLMLLVALFGPSYLKREGVNLSMRASDAIPVVVLALCFVVVVLFLVQAG